MKPYTIHVGDVRASLATLPERSVQLAMTSPPYWALRSYLPSDHAAKALEMGSEPTPEAYIAGQVDVFRAVRRVLRDDGVLVVNYGDSYAAQRSGTHMPAQTVAGGIGGHGEDSAFRGMGGTERRAAHRDAASFGLKHKDLVGIPWRVALALQADGWYLRSAMPWVKRSAMPESVTDRPASAVEYVFLLSKSERYYWDAEAVKAVSMGREVFGNWVGGKVSRNHDRNDGSRQNMEPQTTRNFRNADLWFQSIQGPHGLCGVGDELVGLDVTAEPSREEHFAAYPSRLVEPFVKAGTSEKGCCPACGKPWERIPVHVRHRVRDRALETHAASANKTPQGGYRGRLTTITLGWQPACQCPAHEPVPCTVLDPFSGTGTTGAVACRLGRRYIGCELFEKYAAISERRIEQAMKPNTYRREDDDVPALFAK